MNLFQYDSAFFNGLARVTDFLILNVLWIICSLPIVTMGAATTALYYSMIKIVREKDSGIVKMFFRSFLQNLKQGCCLTIIFLIGGIVLYLGIQTYSTIGSSFSIIAMTILIVSLIIWGIIFSYAFPLLAQFDNTIKNTIKNAFLISISNFRKTLIITVLNLLPIILYLALPRIFVLSSPIWLLLGIAIIAFFNTKIFVKIFDNYIVTDAETSSLVEKEDVKGDKILSIKNSDLCVRISEKGAMICSIQDKDGQEYLWQGDPKYWNDKAPNLFPYIARLTQGKYTLGGKEYSMDIHGFAKDSVFQSKVESDSKVRFILKNSEETYRQYPYEFAFELCYELIENRLEITYAVHNFDSKKMYFGVGAHPGFNVPIEKDLKFEDYYLEFSEEKNVKRVSMSEDCFVQGESKNYPMTDQKKIILSHELFDDDAIILSDMPGIITLKSDLGKKRISVEYPKMNYLGIWHWPRTDAPYVCIEPWSSLPSRKDVIEDFETQENLISLNSGKVYENKVTINIWTEE